MTKKDVIKNYNQKIKEYLKHNKLYFEDSNPILSDSDYDLLKIDILNLEKKYNFLNNKNSPSKNVGFYPSKKFEKFPIFHWDQNREKILSGYERATFRILTITFRGLHFRG